MAAMDTWGAQLRTAGSRHNAILLLKMAVTGQCFTAVRLVGILVSFSLLTMALASVVFSSGPQGHAGIPPAVARELDDHEQRLRTKTRQLAEHEARLEQNDQYHNQLTELRIAERLVRLETNTEHIIWLLATILIALMPLLLAEGYRLVSRPVESRTEPPTDPS